jgi:hypothetical protein
MLILLLSCSRPEHSRSEVTPPDAPGVLLESLTWRTEWDTAGITRLETGWSTTTDLGYTVTITAGQVITYSLGLLPCPEASLGWGLIGTAHAAHGPSLNETSLPAPQAADVAALADASLAHLTFPPARYCTAEALIARADQHTQGIPEGVEMIGRSLSLTGQWRRDGEERSFDLTTTLSTSSRAELTALPPTGQGSHGTLTTRLHPARMFDGIELSEESDARILRATLTHLLTDSTTNLTLTPTETP